MQVKVIAEMVLIILISCILILGLWSNQNLNYRRKSLLAKRKRNSTLVHSPCSPNPSKTTLRYSSTAATTRNCSEEWRLSIATVTWSWRTLRKCGRKCRGLGKGKRRLSPSTRIVLSPRCFCAATRWFWFWEILWQHKLPLLSKTRAGCLNFNSTFFSYRDVRNQFLKRISN